MKLCFWEYMPLTKRLGSTNIWRQGDKLCMTHTASHVLEKLMRSRTNLAVLCYSKTNLCARLLYISQLSVTGEHH